MNESTDADVLEEVLQNIQNLLNKSHSKTTLDETIDDLKSAQESLLKAKAHQNDAILASLLGSFYLIVNEITEAIRDYSSSE